MRKLGQAFLLVCAMSASAEAREFVIGGGYTDFSNDDSQNSGLISLEYHHDPFFERGRFALHWTGGVTVDFQGDTHVGLGLAGTYDLSERWFLEGSVMPGAYFEGETRNKMGGNFQFRSLLGIGYELNSGDKLSLAIAHISNASTNDYNPGMNMVQMRWLHPF